MVPSSTPSANEPAKGPILVHTIQLKAMIKVQISGMVSSGISIVAFPSVYSEKKCLMMMMTMIIIITSNRKPIY